MSEFLAEARVRVRPDTTGFRAELETAIVAATKGITATIPIVPVSAGAGAAAVAQQAQAAAVASTQAARAGQEVAGVNAQVAASARHASSATADLTRVYTLNSVAASRLAGIEEAMSLTTTSLAASRARLREVNAAAAISNQALSRAIATGNVALVQAQLNVTRLVAATRQLAVADVQATIAEGDLATAVAARGRAEAFATRGAAASVLSLLGVRGATLAANSAFLLGAAGAVTFFKSLAIAAEVERNLNTFRITARATGEEMAAVAERARELGNDISLPAVSAGDAVTAMLELSKAGLSVSESMDAARGSLQLATAAEIGNAEAVELVANALNVFQLNGREAVTVADLLAASSLEAQGSIEDMGIALRQSASVANQAGLSLSETVTLLTELARNGLAGSDAGTTLRVAISRLIAPTARAREEIERLNLDLRDAQGNLRVDVFSQLGRALEDVSKQRQSEILVRIFGENAQRVGAILSDVTVPALRQTEKAVTRSGVAAEVAGARVEGLGGKIERTKNEAEDLGLTLGDIFSPAAGVGLDLLNFTLDQTNATIQELVQGFEELGSFEDDANQLATAFRSISEESGFTEFVRDVSSGAQLLADDMKRASDATDDFVSDLLGISGSSDKADTKIKKLTATEKAFAEGIRDANLGLAEQIARLNATADAADGAEKAIAIGLDVRLAVAEATGASDQSILAILREREANQAAFLERMLSLPQTKSRQATVERAARNLEQTRDQIQSIIDSQAAENEQAAQDAARAASDADSAIVDAISAQESRLTNRVIAAQATASLQDDIRTQEALRDFFKRSIEEVRKTVRDAKLRAAEIASLTRDLITAQQEVRRLKDEQKQALQEERREERERQRESLSLDVQIAEATGNRAAEARARQAEIDFLKQQIQQTRRGSNQRKRLILELRQAEKELRELQGADSDRNKAAEFFFEQLQAQQGFAANLLGNLITGPTTGLVGVPSPTPDVSGPGRGIATAQAVAEGRQAGGPTSGQTNTTNDILLRILAQLRVLNGSYDAPEAIHQKKVGGGSMDNFAM